ncbi:MAG TPA: DUF2071 domain-containing protein [Thermoanaerobaculia bacterium]|nr:DUF2071 domain-containing protein [Thermoanaerobaculia bacterium]
MKLPKVHGLIRRRLLVNYRLDPDVAQRQLPSTFHPKLHNGFAIAGICLIRLENIRPKRFPSLLGISSENAAHRFAVTWDDREGVYIPRRDSNSLINHLAGGRLFPGEHQRATFNVNDDGSHVELSMRSADDAVHVRVSASVSPSLPPTSIFQSIAEASTFFEAGSLGYSATRNSGKLDGIVLRTHEWRVEPLAVDEVASSYFADESRFPRGSVTFDCALIMRNIAHEWESAAEMYA